MRYGRPLLFALVTLALLAAPPARAEKAHEPHDSTAQAEPHPKDAHGKSSEPPIFAPVRIDLGIWTLVVFLLLFFILAKYAWGPMLDGLRRREESIRQAIEEAQRTREEAARSRTELERQLAQSNDRARQLLDQARQDAQRLADDMLARARDEIQRERERLHSELETARDQALQEIWNRTTDLATLVSSKVIRRQLHPDDQRRLVSEALDELRRAGEQRQRGFDGSAS